MSKRPIPMAIWPQSDFRSPICERLGCCFKDKLMENICCLDCAKVVQDVAAWDGMLLIPQFRLKHRLNALRTATTLSLPSSSLGERTLNSELNAQSFQPNQFPPHRRKTLFDCTTDIVIVPRTRCFRSEPAPPPHPHPPFLPATKQLRSEQRPCCINTTVTSEGKL